jgi:microcystin-dependent protein
MSEPYLGQLMQVAFNFAPPGWAFCDGQLLPIAQNQALFSLLGTIYGGDGETTFALPEMRGRVAVHSGNGSAGPGLSPVPLGARGGAPTNTLVRANLPADPPNGFSGAGDSASPTGHVPAAAEDADRNGINLYSSQVPDTTMRAGSGGGGSSQSMTNMQPYTAVNYVIALTGVFPSPN